MCTGHEVRSATCTSASSSLESFRSLLIMKRLSPARVLSDLLAHSMRSPGVWFMSAHEAGG